MLDSGGSYLLVVTERFLRLWSVEATSLVSTVPTSRQCKWCCLTSHKQAIYGFGDKMIIRRSWKNATDSVEIKLKIPKADGEDDTTLATPLKNLTLYSQPMNPSEIESQVDKVLISPDDTLGIMQTSQLTLLPKRSKHFLLINTAMLKTLYSDQEIEANLLAHSLKVQLEMPLGFVMDYLCKKDRRTSTEFLPFLSRPNSFFPPASAHVLVFLSKDFWICTYVFSEGLSARVRRHFFLPRDWHNMDLLKLACLTPDGRLLCPRNGELAIIENGLNEDWVD